jgi:hypothetical protein
VAGAYRGERQLENNRRVLPLRGTGTMLAWIRNANDWWYQPDHSMVSGADLLITGLADGRWRVRWLDTRSGEVRSEDTAVVVASRVGLKIPAFS